MKETVTINKAMLVRYSAVIALVSVLLASSQPLPLRQMEFLGRGVVALRIGADKVFVSWRILATDPDDIAFNLYRQVGNQKPIRVNKNPFEGHQFCGRGG
jgi:rhamnogalacturonan endolyase